MRLATVLAALSMSLTAASVAIAADDPIKARQSAMKNVGKAMGAAAAMAKGETGFDARVAELAFRTMNSSAIGLTSLFPDGSQTGGKTEASPKIWQDQAGFAAAVAKFETDTLAAINPAPTDLDTFKAAFGKVAGNCKSCHEAYRIKKN